MTNELLYAFVKESNAIENIFRDPTTEEINELRRFINLSKVTIDDMTQFVKIYQPDAYLRDKEGLNVRIGNYYPPCGGPYIRKELIELLESNYTPFNQHILYEKLHPYTDGNGRSGRALWAWRTKNIKHGFLITWYRQTLVYYNNKGL